MRVLHPHGKATGHVVLTVSNTTKALGVLRTQSLVVLVPLTMGERGQTASSSSSTLFRAAWLVVLGGNPVRPSYPPGYPLGYVERGSASWYGPGFHGNRTANGELYDMHQLTAAHRTLPLGSVAEVRSLSTGRQVTVRINDRGPFARGRILDLSFAGDQEMGMSRPGTDVSSWRNQLQESAGEFGFMRSGWFIGPANARSIGAAKGDTGRGGIGRFT